ncbi:Abortive infection protein [Micrococcus lylae]|uniref:Abortive infection protein n=1 Tax=Micrococcus lylae TaxID=1273 RepID=A0A1R4JYI6_9MICC|nr:Abortive infection protein [Micrococcus lylae]
MIIGATATAVTAGVGEELFFRLWLQTRLEALLGAPAGIALASTFFGLMHLTSHGSGNLMLDVAQVVVVQGTFGLFLGILWWRFRNLWFTILAHLITNGWPVLVWLVTQA